jgi:putative two-component system response regulator
MTKVMVVDDELSLRVTLSKFLSNSGFEVSSFSNAIEAQEAFIQLKPDIVVSDIIMPKSTGIDLLMAIRAMDKEVQFIIMTGEPTLETAVLAIQNGASDYISKPIHKDEFLRIIHKADEIKRLLDEKKDLEARNFEYQKNLETMVERRTLALQDSMKSIILLLSQVVETRDPYTAGHQRRVGNLAAAIAEKMNLPKKQVEEIRIVGYIHDIGKISIPAEILSKPGKLSDLEMAMLRNHSQVGFEMLKGVNFPDTFAKAIHQHHERVDGSGYPLGLKSDQILLEGHILMVADVVEAMMSHRPYRPSLGKEVALNEILSKKGTKYRADIVDACIEVFNIDKYEYDDITHELHIQT